MADNSWLWTPPGDIFAGGNSYGHTVNAIHSGDACGRHSVHGTLMPQGCICTTV